MTLGRHGDDRFHRAVYVISVAAELSGLHPQTLRIYEQRGLLAPARTAGGSRRYSEADLARLARILELTDQGLNLAGVLRVLELEQQVSELQAQIHAHKAAQQQVTRQPTTRQPTTRRPTTSRPTKEGDNRR